MNTLIKLTALTFAMLVGLVLLSKVRESMPPGEHTDWLFVFAHVVFVSAVIFIGLHMNSRRHLLCYIFGCRWEETKRRNTRSYLFKNFNYSKVEDTCCRCGCKQEYDEIAGVDEKWHVRTFYPEPPKRTGYDGIKRAWWNKPNTLH